ncbi:uncharacterized protein V1518DRAFT_54915 [Limtongia smithiae]|uniref:uncharacterized protein n=1 Tax=Limtongia smithiae TaxID=1125753 RepID=UPI0034CF7C91
MPPPPAIMAAPKNLVALDDRVASFRAHKTSTGGAKRTAVKAWPHAKPTVAQMANAGFIFNPLPHSADNATCFLCDKSLDNWTKEDDPNLEHLTHSPDCAWAIIHGTNWTADAHHDPNSEEMQLARLESFGSWWPHDGKRGWMPTSQNVSQAGFFYSPSIPGDDIAACMYCGMVLDGWEPKDNPIEEHRRRCESCYFFTRTHEVAPKTTKRQSRARSSTAATTTSRKRSSSFATLDYLDTQIIEQMAKQPKRQSRDSDVTYSGEAEALQVVARTVVEPSPQQRRASTRVSARSRKTEDTRSVQPMQPKRARGPRPMMQAKQSPAVIKEQVDESTAAADLSHTTAELFNSSEDDERIVPEMPVSPAAKSPVAAASEKSVSLSPVSSCPSRRSSRESSSIDVDADDEDSSRSVQDESFASAQSSNESVGSEISDVIASYSETVYESAQELGTSISVAPASTRGTPAPVTTENKVPSVMVTPAVAVNPADSRVPAQVTTSTPHVAALREKFGEPPSSTSKRVADNGVARPLATRENESRSMEVVAMTESPVTKPVSSPRSGLIRVRAEPSTPPQRRWGAMGTPAKRLQETVFGVTEQDDAALWAQVLGFDVESMGSIPSGHLGKTVEEWIQYVAETGERALLAKCERLVVFLEDEAKTALGVLGVPV